MILVQIFWTCIIMAMTSTYSETRENFASKWDEVESSRDPLIISRRGHEDLALLPADELRGIMETAHLMRSPKNAARLLASLERSANHKKKRTESIEALKQSLGL